MLELGKRQSGRKLSTAIRLVAEVTGGGFILREMREVCLILSCTRIRRAIRTLLLLITQPSSRIRLHSGGGLPQVPSREGVFAVAPVKRRWLAVVGCRRGAHRQSRATRSDQSGSQQ